MAVFELFLILAFGTLIADTVLQRTCGTRQKKAWKARMNYTIGDGVVESDMIVVEQRTRTRRQDENGVWYVRQ